MTAPAILHVATERDHRRSLRQARDRMIAAIRGDVPFVEYARARDRYFRLRERELEAVD